MDIGMTPLISVIIPTKNSEFYYEAIMSIINQTLHDIEVLVIDDSHSDLIQMITANLNDPRVKYFRGNKAGISDALNIGIKKSHGRYIARMDDDDFSLPDRLQKQLDYLLKSKLDVCGSNIMIMGNNKLIKYPEYNNQINYCLDFYCALAHPTILAKAEFYKNNMYATKYSTEEDYDLWLRTRNKYTFGNIQFPLLKYRIHQNQASRNIVGAINMSALSELNGDIFTIYNKITSLKIKDNEIIENMLFKYIIYRPSIEIKTIYFIMMNLKLRLLLKCVYYRYVK